MEEYGAEGNITGPTKLTPVGMPEYNDLIEATLLARLKPGYIANIQEEGRETSDTDILTFIKDTLIECEALVAGGFLLGTIHNYDRLNNKYQGPTNINNHDPKLDMDFYVPCRNLVKFNKIFAKLIDAHSVAQHNATFYCSSFLRRNGIRSVQTFYSFATENYLKKPLIDIMAVRNARSPLDVVQNFDLSFCQIWYDGKNVWATHPEDVKTKTGILQGDYVKLLLHNNNNFLKKRINKYKERGFTIRYDKNVLKTLDEITIIRGRVCPRDKNETYYKKWVTRFVLYSLLYTTYKITGGYNSVRRGEINTNVRGHPATFGEYDNGYRLITDKREPIDTMQIINVTDGYDTDDYDITEPTTFYPELNRMAVNLPAEIQEAWIAQPNDLKFHKVLNILLSNYYSTNPQKSPIDIQRYIDGYISGMSQQQIDNGVSEFIFDSLNFSTIGHDNLPDNPGMSVYTNVLKNAVTRIGTDMVALDDDVPVYDLHLHTVDEAIGVNGMKDYLNQFIGQLDKSHIPCYVDGCTMTLTLDEIRSIVGKEYYMRFAEPVPEPLLPPDLLLGEFDSSENGPNGEVRIIKRKLGTEMIRNVPTSTDKWGNNFHWVMCPFCLEYISRDAGCTYVVHQDDRLGTSKPYCKPQNIVKEVLDKYQNAGYNEFEICIQCGRPCSNHQHLNLNDPPGLAPEPLTALGQPDYSKCAGGGRREGLARMIAVRKTVQENPGMEPIALRRLAGLAAEAGARNEAFLTQADGILAKPVADRVNTNLNRSVNDIINAFRNLDIPNMPNDIYHAGGRRVGAVCPHGYENYREKIPTTRKRSHKKRKGTRKSKTN